MGVPKLWELVKPALHIQTLDAAALREAFDDNGAIKGLCLGVDTSIWINAIMQAHSSVRRITRGRNAELQTVLYRLARLASKPISAVFVFDGAARPAEKRGRKVMQDDYWIVEHLKEFAQAYGFHVHVAPGEAEAELAAMNRAGVIDAVLTDDSDALVFGARAVMRNSSRKVDKDDVHLYDAATIASHSEVALTRGGLVLVAVLSGNDYGPGLEGCGAHVARDLAQYGLGEALIEASELNGAARNIALDQWRDWLRTCLREDPRKFLKRRQPALADKITNAFPDVRIVRFYTHPTVTTNGWAIPVAFGVHPLAIDVPKIAQLCRDHFGWGRNGDYGTLLKKMNNFVWPAVAFRAVTRDTYGRPPADNRVACTGNVNVAYTVSRKITPTDRKKDLRRVALRTRALALTAVYAVASTDNRHGRDLTRARAAAASATQTMADDAVVSVRLPGAVIRRLERLSPPPPAAAAAPPAAAATAAAAAVPHPAPVINPVPLDAQAHAAGAGAWLFDNADDLDADGADPDGTDDNDDSDAAMDDWSYQLDSSLEPFFPVAGPSSAATMAGPSAAAPSSPLVAGPSSVHAVTRQRRANLIDLTTPPPIEAVAGIENPDDREIVDLTVDLEPEGYIIDLTGDGSEGE